MLACENKQERLESYLSVDNIFPHKLILFFAFFEQEDMKEVLFSLRAYYHGC